MALSEPCFISVEPVARFNRVRITNRNDFKIILPMGTQESVLPQCFNIFFISHLFYFGVFQQPHCYTSVTSQLQEAEGFD